MTEDKTAKFTTNIPQEQIDAAMASVDKAKASSEAAAVDEAQLAELRAENEQLKAQLDFSQTKARETLEKLKEEHDRLLRAAADLDNQKKRAQREQEDSLRFGLEKFLKELLPVVDNLDRAMAHADTSDKDALLQGVKMTMKLLEDVLGRHGVKPFSGAGQVFDPRVHEAMQQVETLGPSNMVAEEFLRGYTLNDRLIRPALVAVSRQKESAPAAPQSAAPAPVAEGKASEPAAVDEPNEEPS